MRTCSECKADVGFDHPDPCIGLIPGVSHACCGHGHVGTAYVVIGGAPNEGCAGRRDWVTLRGADALAFFAMVKRWEHPRPEVAA